MKKQAYLLAVLAICSVQLCPAQVKTDGYKVQKNIQLTGDGFWDYLVADQETGRLYVSHGTMVQVIDLKTEKNIGTIPGTPGVHGIAIAKEFGKGFISAGKIDSLIVFDLSTLKVKVKIKTDKNPDAILYDPYSKRIFCFNGRGNSATVVDAASNEVVGTLQLPGKPEYAVSDKNGRIFVNIEDKSTLVRFDARTLKIEAEWTLGNGKEPTGLALDTEHNRLFSACSGSNTIVVLDSWSGRIMASLPMGEGCDGIIFIPEDQNALASCGEGLLTVVHQESPHDYSVVQTIPTRKSARTITYSNLTGKIYLSSADVSLENGKRKVAAGSFRVIVMSRL